MCEYLLKTYNTLLFFHLETHFFYEKGWHPMEKDGIP
jgi:hypothetical protein